MTTPATVINAISEQIGASIREFTLESHFPSRDADAMDDKLKAAKHQTVELRRIRQEYEDLMFGKP